MTTPTTPQDRATEDLQRPGKTTLNPEGIDVLSASAEDLYWAFARGSKTSADDLMSIRNATVEALAPRPAPVVLDDAALVRLIYPEGAPHSTDTVINGNPDRVRIAREAFALGASSASAEALTRAKREAASKAWDAVGNNVESAHPGNTLRTLADWIRTTGKEGYLAREYPPITPPSVVLSDGSYFWWFKGSSGRITWNRTPEDQRPVNGVMTNHGWVTLMKPTDTGEDFEKVKALAATLSPTGAER